MIRRLYDMDVNPCAAQDLCAVSRAVLGSDAISIAVIDFKQAAFVRDGEAVFV